MQSNKKAIGYCRTAKKETDGGAIEMQERALQQFALENGYSDFTIYSDNGYSGVTLDRPAFNEMRRKIADGEIGTVVVTEYSRICRNSATMMRWLAELAEKKVEVIAIEQDRLTAVGPAGFLKGGGGI